MKIFMRVEWHHNFDDEPVVLWSEIVDGVETRKVEVYRDGRLDYADASSSTGSTRLSEVLMPSAAEIASSPEFSPQEVSSKEFDDIWNRAKRQK